MLWTICSLCVWRQSWSQLVLPMTKPLIFFSTKGVHVRLSAQPTFSEVLCTYTLLSCHSTPLKRRAHKVSTTPQRESERSDHQNIIYRPPTVSLAHPIILSSWADDLATPRKREAHTRPWNRHEAIAMTLATMIQCTTRSSAITIGRRRRII